MNNKSKRPHDLSLVIPCYNEESTIKQTIPEIIDGFLGDKINIQLILVNNGSTDQTENIIDHFISNNLPVKKVNVSINKGYGNGILRGLEKCDGNYVGFICADGQVAAQDIVKLYHVVEQQTYPVLGKVRRRFRTDGIYRKFISGCYNIMFSILFPNMQSIDINGNPKIFSNELLRPLALCSNNWFLDAELMIKASKMNLSVMEINVKGCHRAGGKSNVRLQTCLEFIASIYKYKFGHILKEWEKNLDY